MVAQLLGDLFQRVGPFLIPVVVFGAGAVGYAILWLYYNWATGEQRK